MKFLRDFLIGLLAVVTSPIWAGAFFLIFTAYGIADFGAALCGRKND